MCNRKIESSRIPGFYQLSIEERINVIATFANLTKSEVENILNFESMNETLADAFIENTIGTFSLPLGIATNFKINNTDILIPMAVEESSVVAAASFGAKLVRENGGFSSQSTDPIMIGQIQLKNLNQPFDNLLRKHKQLLIDYANDGQSRLLKRGGGVKDLSWYYIKNINSLIIQIHVHTCEAMGANIVNTLCESLAKPLINIFPRAKLGLRILSNLSLYRRAKAKCTLSPKTFEKNSLRGQQVVDNIVDAWDFAYHDIFRAATHNKGIMNGIDPVLIATGNDWRAVEAGAHAFASQGGNYRPMTTWSKDKDFNLKGELEIPIAVGTIGGVTKLHPTAQASLKLLGNPNAKQLSEYLCCVGLAQNLSALRALSSEGIQHGHMNLHQKNISLNSV